MTSTIPPSSRPKSTASVNYEQYAPRNESQLNRLSRLATLTSGPTFSSSINKTQQNTSSIPQQQNQKQPPHQQQQHPSASLLLTAMSPPPLHDTSSFVPSTTNASSTPENSSSITSIHNTILTSELKIQHLQSILTHATALSTSLSSALSLSTSLSQRHSHLIQHSTELSTAAERLQAEESILSRHAEEIGAPLRHYDAIDEIGILVGVLFKDEGQTVVRGLAKIKVDGPEYVPLLDRIDAAMAFFANGSGGGGEYRRRAGILREAALDLWRDAVVTRLKTITRDVYEALDLGSQAIVADKLEASLAYTRFYGISGRSRSLVRVLARRVEDGKDAAGDGRAYSDLLLLARNTFCFSRERLLKNSVRVHMEKLRGEHGLVGMTRLASVFLLRICTSETNLYLEFFGEDKNADVGKEDLKQNNQKERESLEDTIELTAKAKMKKKTQVLLATSRVAFEDEIFQGMLSTLCSAFYRSIRRGLVMVNDLDTLCQIVSVLRDERGHANSTRVTVAASRAISGVIQDAQERLIFCANMLMQKEVVRFKAKPEDLDYPNKLLVDNTKRGNDRSGNAKGKADAVQAQLEIYEGWFPPMRSVLKILSKIFRVVEPRVFEDIAQQSVQACTKCLKEGSLYILMHSGVVHADLFLVKHLLILREQLSPFDIQLRSIERQLDFTETTKAVTKFLANRNRRLFSMSTENALVTLLREGISVQESSVDSKRDLEDALRSACNDFIEHTFAKLIRPLLGFVEDCKGATAAEVDLTKEPFLKGENVVLVMQKTLEGFDPEITAVTKEMSIYLDNVATQGILLKPVVKKITRALEEAKKFIGQVSDSDDAESIGWTKSVKWEVERLIKELEVMVKGSGSKLVSR